MSTINTIRARLKALNVKEESRQAIEKTKPEIIALNRERMLAGQRTDGSYLPFYSKISQEVYGYPNTPIALYATGDFQKAIKVEVGFNVIKTTSIDPKEGMLIKRYGEGIHGLDKEGKQEYIKDLRPVFVKNVRAILSL